MLHGEPGTVLKALGYFNDGDLQTLTAEEMITAKGSADRIAELPQNVTLTPGWLGGGGPMPASAGRDDQNPKPASAT